MVFIFGAYFKDGIFEKLTEKPTYQDFKYKLKNNYTVLKHFGKSCYVGAANGSILYVGLQLFDWLVIGNSPFEPDKFESLQHISLGFGTSIGTYHLVKDNAKLPFGVKLGLCYAVTGAVEGLIELWEGFPSDTWIDVRNTIAFGGTAGWMSYLSYLKSLKLWNNKNGKIGNMEDELVEDELTDVIISEPVSSES